MNELAQGLAVFGAMFIGVIVLFPVFLLQKAIADKRNEEKHDEYKRQLENQPPL